MPVKAMQTSLSELLMTEHNVILEAGKLVESNNKLWESDPSAYKEFVNYLFGFFSVYADEFHHQKEEEILFPAISKVNEMAGMSIVQELAEQHEDFRQLVQEIRIVFDRQDYAATQQYLESYMDKLRDHIAAENDELFPMADDILSAEEIDRLYFKCIDKDEELGIVRKKDYEEQIKMLKRNETVQ
ncbi:MAG TPA: hemerythrin domain-containing protein [Chitinophagaceae bacterium]|nr:hemerythrin domain-containing protein [Chitinophagaceae bacterium]